MKPVEIQVIMRSEDDSFFAHGVFNGKEVTVFKGSKVFISDQDKLHGNKLMLKKMDENGILMQDMHFQSPTAASNFVCGKASNGWQAWITPEGIPLEDLRNRGTERGKARTGRKVRSDAGKPVKPSELPQPATMAAQESTVVPNKETARLDKAPKVSICVETPQPGNVQDPRKNDPKASDPAEDAPKTWRLLLCSDVCLGAVSPENLDIRQSKKWREARISKFTDLMDLAVQEHALYVILFGELFGEDRVSESIIDVLFETVRDSSIQVLSIVNEREYKRITYRSDIPENFHLINSYTNNAYQDDHIILRASNETVKIFAGKDSTLIVQRNSMGQLVLSGMAATYPIPVFEPTCFENANDALYGYGILEWTKDRWIRFTTHENKQYEYRTVELKILPEDDQKEILRKINSLARTFGPDTFLRVTVTGRSAFGLTINSDALKNQLQSRIFFVEAYDNTVMDIDEESFETDISLRSEFVRLALQDGSLSESERNRLISLGWNALRGGEVSAE